MLGKRKEAEIQTQVNNYLKIQPHFQSFKKKKYYTSKPDEKGYHAEVPMGTPKAVKGVSLYHKYRYAIKKEDEKKTQSDLKIQPKQRHFQSFNRKKYYNSMPDVTGIHPEVPEGTPGAILGTKLTTIYRRKKEFEDKENCFLEIEKIKCFLNTEIKNDEFKKADLAAAGSLSNYDSYPLEDSFRAYAGESLLSLLLKREENINKHITRYHQLNAKLGIQETEFTPVTATYTRDLLQKKREKILPDFHPLYNLYSEQKKSDASFIEQGLEEEVNILVDFYHLINGLLETQSESKVDTNTNAVTTTPTLTPMSSSSITLAPMPFSSSIMLTPIPSSSIGTELNNRPTVSHRNMLFTPPQISEQEILNSFFIDKDNIPGVGAELDHDLQSQIAICYLLHRLK